MLAVAAALCVAIVSQPPAFTPEPGWRSVTRGQVRVTDPFWQERMKINATATLQANLRQCAETGRIDNFKRAAGTHDGPYAGLFFNDSDVYKAIEGAAYVYAQTSDAGLDRTMDEIIALIAAAQQPDGYINAYYTVTAPTERLTNLRDKHELYCGGHLIEAGVAHRDATGKRTLFDVGVRFADYLLTTFGEGKRRDVCGHPEIEIALVRLADATGERKYRELAEFFLRERGQSNGRELYGEYAQDHVPIVEQPEVVGHAVRAMYLYAAATDAWVPRDKAATEAMSRLYTDVTQRKMYVTGGIGSSADNEGFTTAFDLPNDTAYAETCAGISLVMWSRRLAAYGWPDAANIMERGLYNGVLSGVSLEGDRFFYVNPLASRGGHARVPWFECACCPPNILRLIASVGEYVYAQDDDSLRVNMYIGSDATVRLANTRVNITQRTRGPWQGETKLIVSPEKPALFDVVLRIPSWAGAAFIDVAGTPITDPPSSAGYVTITRPWKSGDVVNIKFETPVNRLRADPRVEADVGRVALQRGPFIYCIEGTDNGGHVRSLAIPPANQIAPVEAADLFGGVMTLRGTAVRSSPDGDAPMEFTAIPYFAWCNRGPGEMVVWVPESTELAERPLDPSVTATVSHCYSNDTPAAMYDRQVPAKSLGAGISRMTWWPRQGTEEWAQYDFESPRDVSSCDVYWFDDSGRGGGCAAPESWRVMVKVNGEWREASNQSAGGVQLDTFNRVEFDVVRAEGVRLMVKLREGKSGGILEWNTAEKVTQ